MVLTSRIALTGATESDPEDFLSSSLGVIFPDDVTSQHGDADHGLAYTSPHLPKPLHISLADPKAEEDRRLFSHYLWNSSLLLAELIEAGTLGLSEERLPPFSRQICSSVLHYPCLSSTSPVSAPSNWARALLLPSLMSALLGPTCPRDRLSRAARGGNPSSQC